MDHTGLPSTHTDPATASQNSHPPHDLNSSKLRKDDGVCAHVLPCNSKEKLT